MTPTGQDTAVVELTARQLTDKWQHFAGRSPRSPRSLAHYWAMHPDWGSPMIVEITTSCLGLGIRTLCDGRPRHEAFGDDPMWSACTYLPVHPHPDYPHTA